MKTHKKKLQSGDSREQILNIEKYQIGSFHLKTRFFFFFYIYNAFCTSCKILFTFSFTYYNFSLVLIFQGGILFFILRFPFNIMNNFAFNDYFRYLSSHNRSGRQQCPIILSHDPSLCCKIEHTIKNITGPKISNRNNFQQFQKLIFLTC